MRTRFLGQYLLSQGLITASQLLEAVEYQNRSNSRLGELAVARGVVSAEQADEINALQGRQDLFFGEAAVKLGLMTSAQIEDLLVAQQDAHIRLGQALLALGHVSEPELQRALSDFKAQEARYEPGLHLPEDWCGTAVATPLLRVFPRVLMRTWTFASKPESACWPDQALVLSDLNVSLALANDVRALLFVGVPYAAAHKATIDARGSTRPDAAALQAAVVRLGDSVGHHLTSISAERGQRMQHEPATLCGRSAPIDPGQRALAVPFLTHVGKIVVGLIA